MNTLKQLSKIKNSLLDAKLAFAGIEDAVLESKLDMALANFLEAYSNEIDKLRVEGKTGNDLLLMIRD